MPKVSSRKGRKVALQSPSLEMSHEVETTKVVRRKGRKVDASPVSSVTKSQSGQVVEASSVTVEVSKLSFYDSLVF